MYPLALTPFERVSLFRKANNNQKWFSKVKNNLSDNIEAYTDPYLNTSLLIASAQTTLPNRATFEYSYSLASFRTNRDTVFL